ncbi:protein of unknown function [Ralstonia solanacearum CFBP2957]|nr:protein of unknown function [Ralstonia solanacearum CFBP2957]
MCGNPFAAESGKHRATGTTGISENSDSWRLDVRCVVVPAGVRGTMSTHLLPAFCFRP